MHPPSDIDRPQAWKRCPECGEKAAGVRRDARTKLVLCNWCWFETDPAEYGHPEGR